MAGQHVLLCPTVLLLLLRLLEVTYLRWGLMPNSLPLRGTRWRCACKSLPLLVLMGLVKAVLHVDGSIHQLIPRDLVPGWLHCQE